MEVARQGSFSAAARRLQLSPSAVSKLIGRLETRLDSRLFNRTTRRLSLTEGGQEFHDRCVQILADIESAEENLAGLHREPRGVLAVTCSPAFAKYQLVPLLSDFLRQHPRLELKLQITGETLDLIRHDLDVAIRHGALQDSSLVAKKLGESRRIVCASPDYLRRHGSPRRPAELKGHNCLVPTGRNMNLWRFTRSGRSFEAAVAGNVSCATVEALRDLALQDMGIVNLAEFMVAPDLEAGRLTPLLRGYRTEVQPVHAVYLHRQQLPSKVRVFVDFLEQRFSQAGRAPGSTRETGRWA